MTRPRQMPRIPEARDLSWQDHAACRGADPDLFFPDVGKNDAADDARRVCAACPVRDACLDYAIDTGQRYGIWGGTNDKERRPMRAARQNRGAA